MDIQKFLTYCIAKLVDHPDVISISERVTPEKTIFEVRVSQHDVARVIGKEGRTYKALRALINLPHDDGVNYDLYVDKIT